MQVEAVNGFRAFVEALDEAGRVEAKLSPILKDLLQHFFKVAAEVEAMDVVMTVDTIVERLGEAVQPHAVDCAREVPRPLRFAARAVHASQHHCVSPGQHARPWPCQQRRDAAAILTEKLLPD